MKILITLIVIAVLLALAVVVAGQLGLLAGKQPNNLGVKDGKLKPPSKTPNSVSSQAGLYPDHPQLAYAKVEPLKFTGDGAKAMEKLAKLLQNRERTVLVSQGPDYIYAQCTSALLKFTDDVEFMLDASAGVIQVRSSSRLGRKDFGVNRERIEAIRTAFAAP